MRRLIDDFVITPHPDWTEPYNIQFDHIYINGVKLFKRNASDNTCKLMYRIPLTRIKVESDIFDIWDNETAVTIFNTFVDTVRMINPVIKEYHFYG